jgi:hypothetical protein
MSFAYKEVLGGFCTSILRGRPVCFADAGVVAVMGMRVMDPYELSNNKQCKRVILYV